MSLKTHIFFEMYFWELSFLLKGLLRLKEHDKSPLSCAVPARLNTPNSLPKIQQRMGRKIFSSHPARPPQMGRITLHIEIKQQQNVTF